VRARSRTELPAPLNELAREIEGTVVGRSSPSYDQARELYNTRFDGIRPLAVVYCQSVSDVQKTIAWSRKYGIRIAARSGGHSYAGYSGSSGGVVVDVSRLNRVAAGTGRVATVGAGARLIDVYSGLWAKRVTIPAGSCGTVGVGGLALGGGVGFLSRKLGTTSDNVLRVTLVTADGKARVCSASENADLYWACRGGGGGNFGIVTSFTFRTTPISKVTTFSVRWPWPQAHAVIAAWQRWAPHAPDALFSVCNISAGDGSPGIAVSGQFVGGRTPLTLLLAPLVSTGTPVSVSVKERDYMTAVLYWAGCGSVQECHLEPFGSLDRATFAAKSDYARRPLSSAAIGAIVSGIGGAPGRGTLLLDSYGGVINRVPKGATAFAHRDMLFSFQYLASWSGAAQAPQNLAWLRSFYKAMRPYVSGQAYVNYIDPDLAGRPGAYYGSNLPRLVAVKRRYDPKNLFRFKQSIPLHLP
jgi:FAD/FMN-containing dehydrogenase